MRMMMDSTMANIMMIMMIIMIMMVMTIMLIMMVMMTIITMMHMMVTIIIIMNQHHDGDHDNDDGQYEHHSPNESDENMMR